MVVSLPDSLCSLCSCVGSHTTEEAVSSSRLSQHLSGVADLFSCCGFSCRSAAQLPSISGLISWFGGAGNHAWQLGRANDLLPCMCGSLDCTVRLGQTASWGPKVSRSGDWAFWPEGATSRAEPLEGLSSHALQPRGTWLAKIHKHIAVRLPSTSLAGSCSDLCEAVPKWASQIVSQHSGEAECPPSALLFPPETL